MKQICILDKNGLYLQCMDGSQICCCELCLDASWFSNIK